MRKLIVSVYTLAASLGAASAFGGCSLGSFHGTYAFADTGSQYGTPYSSSGMESFDGQGNLKYFEKWSTGSSSSTYTGTGTYTVTANCIVTIIYDGDTSAPWTAFLAPNGSVFYYNDNLSDGRIQAGHADRISLQLLIN